ncbi:MAG TPA: DinB family protein [Gemmatimonadaceae bacterium]
MNTTDVAAPLATLLTELVDGTTPTGGYMLNKGDLGLLRALDTLSAEEASRIVDGGSSVAAHVDHCTYYFHLMNRWAAGEKNPWKGADWAASWRKPNVSQDEWARSREVFASETRKWLDVIKEPRDVKDTELTGMIASVVHLAYHLGAIRQMERKIRGPSANNEVDAFTKTS